MTHDPDPGWVRSALAAYDLCLWLYPKQLRDGHGDEMRQAFRDRCREAVRGERSAFRVLMLELLPDILVSAVREQVDATFGDMRPRQLWAFGLLALAALGLLTQDLYSGYVNDLVKSADRKWRQFRTIQEITHREKAVRSLAESLRSGDARDRALAAYLYSSMHISESRRYEYADGHEAGQLKRNLQADGEHSKSAATSVMDGASDAYPLAIAVQSCLPEAGCNVDRAINQFTRREPDNAFAWSLALTRASRAGADVAVDRALRRMAQSGYYEDYQGSLTRDLLLAAKTLAPDDEDFQTQISVQTRRARNLDWDDYHNNVRKQCGRFAYRTSPENHRWIELHPEAENDCLAIAGILARSNDLRAAWWGWQRIANSEPGLQLSSGTREGFRGISWLMRNNQVGMNFSKGRRPTLWKSEQWQAWGETWEPGDGEIPALKRWMAARGIPIVPPADYKGPQIR